jgi:hypothetical protein
VTFEWSAGTGVTGYTLLLGTTGVGSSDLFNSGQLTSTAILVSGLPTNGVKVYARLLSGFNGVTQFSDYTFTAAAQAALTSPAAGSVLPGAGVRFTWLAASTAGQYALWLGSTGVGSNNLYNSGSTSSLSAKVSGLPTNGEMVYARLFSTISGAILFTDYTYVAASQAAMTSPEPGSTLSGPTVKYSWTPGTGATTDYALWVGSTGVDSHNLYEDTTKHSTTVTVTGLPTNGERIYIRLFTTIDGVSEHSDYMYTAATKAKLISPKPGSKLGGSKEAFTWSSGDGAITGYSLWLGSAGVGSHNLYESGTREGTSISVAGLPTNGKPIFVRLFTTFGGVETHTD